MIENRRLSGGSHLLRVRDEHARRDTPQSQPGQFAQLLAHPSQHLVRRPMSIHDEGDGWRSFMVKPVGPATRELVALRAGDSVDMTPPLGKGFPAPGELGEGPVFLVGGGFGVAPMHFMARILDGLPQAPEYRILYGGRTRNDVELDVLAGVNGEVLTSTDDGSLGFHGTCVDLCATQLDALGAARAARAVVLTCGPHAMMHALHGAVARRVHALYASLEEVMACGVGVCMGCVAKTRDGWVPICTHGPVFRSDTVFDLEGTADHV